MNIITIDKIHVKRAWIDGSILNEIGQPILNSFVSAKPPGCKIISEPERIHYKNLYLYQKKNNILLRR